MSRDQLKRLKELEAENTRFRRAVSDLTLDKMILAETARGNVKALPAARNASVMCGKSSVYWSAGSAAYFVSIARRSARCPAVWVLYQDVAYLLRLPCCLAPTNQLDTPPTFKSSKQQIQL
jgi:hypothetical protein